MSDLHELIATSTIRAYNQGARDEREQIVALLEKLADAPECFDLDPKALIELIRGGKA